MLSPAKESIECIFIHTNTYTREHKYIHSCTQIHILVNTNTYTRAHKYIHSCTQIHTLVDISTHKYIHKQTNKQKQRHIHNTILIRKNIFREERRPLTLGGTANSSRTQDFIEANPDLVNLTFFFTFSTHRF